MRILILYIPQATPPIDIEGCGLRDQRCRNVHPAAASLVTAPGRRRLQQNRLPL